MNKTANEERDVVSPVLQQVMNLSRGASRQASALADKMRLIGIARLGCQDGRGAV
ncbi:hypothetical protein NKI72_01795 [Mesorhizobium sp. M0437]|uniref:hypothetical protein n=1 Tax=Mesorhizobium sp. M0437 TaxID=2956945 RepID=UPI003335C311